MSWGITLDSSFCPHEMVAIDNVDEMIVNKMCTINMSEHNEVMDCTVENCPIKADNYKGKLIALCKGLEVQYIDKLIEKEPEDLFRLGKLMADIFKILQAT